MLESRCVIVKNIIVLVFLKKKKKNSEEDHIKLIINLEMGSKDIVLRNRKEKWGHTQESEFLKDTRLNF